MEKKKKKDKNKDNPITKRKEKIMKKMVYLLLIQ